MNKINNETPQIHEIEQNLLIKISVYCNIELEKIDPLAPMHHIAIDSIISMTIVEELQSEYGIDLPTFLFYENETIRDSVNSMLASQKHPEYEIEK